MKKLYCSGLRCYDLQIQCIKIQNITHMKTKIKKSLIITPIFIVFMIIGVYGGILALLGGIYLWIDKLFHDVVIADYLRLIGGVTIMVLISYLFIVIHDKILKLKWLSHTDAYGIFIIKYQKYKKGREKLIKNQDFLPFEQKCIY